MADIITQGWDEYRLLDCGEGRKLERFGPHVIDRPEPQAMGARRLSAQIWAQADAVFAGDAEADDGRWSFRRPLPDTWESAYRGVKFLGRFTPFRHVGYFPEQAPHWDWMLERLSPGDGLLNLFAYTGVASLLAAEAGAEVTHVDASKKAITYAAENQKLAGLEAAKLRWICEDARKFTAREGRRGRRYRGILVDPPKFGRGPDKEVWNLFEDLPEMLRQCAAVLDPETGWLILTCYAVRASHWALHELCRDVFPGFSLESGELVIEEEGGGRKLGAALYCRVWRP
jgi:23S rRNA (cytosine1962-C5)-methyltransferase